MIFFCGMCQYCSPMRRLFHALNIQNGVEALIECNECALLCFVDGNCDFYVYQDGYCCLGDSNFIESPNLEPDFTPTSAEILFKRGKITIPHKQVST